ncbi:RNA polymerase sigma factor RpoD [Bacteroidia bacterium]|nr:RNA polymerase sigma factor RpoD [Bacteroidia bacterium]
MRQLKISKSITNRETASLDKFLQDIGKEELISAEEEVVLAQKIHNGDPKALDKLVRANLRFVVSVAKQYQNQGLSLPDLINEGNLGLIKAAKRFNETLGFKFISFAVWWIRQAILQALAEQSRIVRLPLNQVGSLNKIKKETSKLEQKLERAPTLDELAESMDVARGKLAEVMNITTRYISMDAPLVQDEETSFIDVYISDEAPGTDQLLIRESLSREIERSLSTLTEKEREVINRFYGIGSTHASTLDEIAEDLELTRERVRQIKEKAIRRLKNSSRNKHLKTFLGE